MSKVFKNDNGITSGDGGILKVAGIHNNKGMKNEKPYSNLNEDRLLYNPQKIKMDGGY